MSDPLFDRLQADVRHGTTEDLRRQAHLTESAALTIFSAVRAQHVSSLAGVCSLPGLGKKTIENVYAYLVACQTRHQSQPPSQQEFL